MLHGWQPVLADELDGAGQIVAEARRRLPDLTARVTASSRACRVSLERMILPGAALHLTLGTQIDGERALSVTGACTASDAERAARRAGLLDRTPWLFPIVRYLSVHWSRLVVKRGRAFWLVFLVQVSTAFLMLWSMASMSWSASQ